MKLIAKYPRFFAQLSVYFSTLIRVLLNILLMVISLALAIGVYKSATDLLTSLHKPLEVLLEKILLDTVFIVALVEIAITILGYLKDGSVHVRYIVDTILIIMLNEIVGLWFKDASLEKAGSICMIIGVLALVRISVVRFAPADKTET